MSDVKAIFLDRDGVLNELVHYNDTGENESPRSANDMRIFPDTGKFLRQLCQAGWTLFLTTNQPSYAKGKTSLDNLQRVHQVLLDYLAKESVVFKDFYYCYCHPQSIVAGYGEPCACRKPKPGMLLKAKNDYGVTLHKSWMIGDSHTDIFCGQSAGTNTILITYALSSEKRESTCIPDYITNNLAEAVNIILSGER